MKVPFKCDMLVDQGRYIGEDPVGHACSNDAVYEASEGGPLLCESCRDLLFSEPFRLTLVAPFGKEYQRRVIEATVRPPQ